MSNQRTMEHGTWSWRHVTLPARAHWHRQPCSLAVAHHCSRQRGSGGVCGSGGRGSGGRGCGRGRGRRRRRGRGRRHGLGRGRGGRAHAALVLHDKLLQARFVCSANHAHLLLVAEGLEGRHRLNATFNRNVLVLVDIDLHEADVRVLAREALEEGRDPLARPAPNRRKVDDDRLPLAGGVGEEGVPLFLGGDLLRACCKSSVSACT
mmetsp:Transcript_49506/g.137198  ORF Transcript_49506/g.137198 Transcript_49506/m.137198 type:complete len:207 (+) Transcript_49506:350-970(+)